MIYLKTVDHTSETTVAYTSALSYLPTTTTQLISNSYSVCNNTQMIGIDCNMSSLPCDVSQWCQNSGTCVNDLNITYGYRCICGTGFDGIYCEIDQRPCHTNICYNHGIFSDELRSENIRIYFHI